MDSEPRQSWSGPVRRRGESGQTTVEYGILYAGVILPLTFAIIFVAEMLWVWHSVVDFTRDGAQYAATHCWESNGQNVITYMQTHVPRMVGMEGGAGPVGREGELQHRRRPQQQGIGAAILGLGDDDIAGAAGLDHGRRRIDRAQSP